MIAISLLVTLLLTVLSPVLGRKVQIYHTTDLHGWLAGHRHDAALDADFGDYTSLLQWKKVQSNVRDYDFLAFDTGDILEGTGISDASEFHGQYLFPLVPDEITAITVGNHDMGEDGSVANMHQYTSSHWKDRFVTTNTYYKGALWGAPYKVTTMSSGLRVLNIGVMYTFDLAASTVKVVPPSEMVFDKPFLKAMKEEVDLIVGLLHIPTSSDETKTVYNAIRQHHPNTPLVLLTGHSHQLHFTRPDKQAVIMESGCYFRSIGNLNFEIDDEGTMIVHDQSWMSTSVKNLVFLANVTKTEFLTPKGAYVKQLIKKANDELQLNKLEGCSDLDWNPSSDLDSDDSFYRLYMDEVVPRSLYANAYPHITYNKKWFLTNTHSLRSKLYEGEVILDDILSVSPFNDSIYIIDNIPAELIPAVQDGLNNIHSIDFADYPAYADEDPREIRSNGRLPHYIWDAIEPEEGKFYAAIAAAYDSKRVQRILQDATGTEWPLVAFTKHNSVPVLEFYIQHYMKC